MLYDSFIIRQCNNRNQMATAAVSKGRHSFLPTIFVLCKRQSKDNEKNKGFQSVFRLKIFKRPPREILQFLVRDQQQQF